MEDDEVPSLIIHDVGEPYIAIRYVHYHHGHPCQIDIGDEDATNSIVLREDEILSVMDMLSQILCRYRDAAK